MIRSGDHADRVERAERVTRNVSKEYAAARCVCGHVRWNHAEAASACVLCDCTQFVKNGLLR